MRQINLLPKEILERRRSRQVTLILAAAVGGLIAVLLLITILQAGRLSSARSSLDRQNGRNRSLQSQIDQLSRFATLQQDLANRQALLTALTSGEIRWSVVLGDVATIIPADVWLTNFSGTAQAGGAATSAGEATFAQLQFSGCTLLPPDGTHLAVAKWLVRLDIPKGFVNPYLSLSAKGSGTCPVNFSSTAGLGDAALRKNERGGERTP